MKTRFALLIVLITIFSVRGAERYRARNEIREQPSIERRPFMSDAHQAPAFF